MPETMVTDSEDCDEDDDEDEDELIGSFLDISKYFLASEFSDVSIICGAETFPAHRFVLEGRSTKQNLNKFKI